MTWLVVFSSPATARPYACLLKNFTSTPSRWRSSAERDIVLRDARPTRAAILMRWPACRRTSCQDGRATPCPKSARRFEWPSAYLLDTNICIYIAKHNRRRARGSSSSVLMRWPCRWSPWASCGTAQKKPGQDKALAVLQQLQAAIQVMPLAPLPVHITARSAPPWSAPGSPLATTIVDCRPCTRRGLVLVTNNEREFCQGAWLYGWRTGLLP